MACSLAVAPQTEARDLLLIIAVFPLSYILSPIIGQDRFYKPHRFLLQ
jgi:hypothetical protein